eukprot:7380643-Prymnesium_polylepis.1
MLRDVAALAPRHQGGTTDVGGTGLGNLSVGPPAPPLLPASSILLPPPEPPAELPSHASTVPANVRRVWHAPPSIYP